jgi:hypothetical protein
MQVQRFTPLLVIVIAAFGLVSSSVLCAQHSAVTLQFNVPYQCSNGKTLTVRSCEMRESVEMCAYDRSLTGQPLHPAYVRRSTLENWLRNCQPMPGQASARPPANPTTTTAGTNQSGPPKIGMAPGSTPAATAQPTNPPYLAEFPSVERVKSEMQGKDAMDTAARQMGAFWQLQEIIKGMSGLRWTTNALTPDEERLLGQYAAGYQAASQPYANYPDRPAWYRAHAFYETNRDFRDELFRRLLNPGIQAQWAQITGDTRARVEASKAQRQIQTGAPGLPASGSRGDEAAQAVGNLIQGMGRWRWVIERTFAWLNQFRRLRVRYEKRADIHEAFFATRSTM